MSVSREIDCEGYPYSELGPVLYEDTATPRIGYLPRKESSSLNPTFLYKRGKELFEPEIKVEDLLAFDRRNLLRDNVFESGGARYTRWMRGDSLHHWHMGISPSIDGGSLAALDEIVTGSDDPEYVAATIKGFMPDCEVASNENISIMFSTGGFLSLFSDGKEPEMGTNANDCKPINSIYNAEKGIYHFWEVGDMYNIFGNSLGEDILDSFPDAMVEFGVRLSTMDFHEVVRALEEGIRLGNLEDSTIRKVIDPYIALRLGKES